MAEGGRGLSRAVMGDDTHFKKTTQRCKEWTRGAQGWKKGGDQQALLHELKQKKKGFLKT